MKILHLAISTTIFIVLLCALYITHIHFFKVDVVFYSALADGLIAAALSGLILWRAKRFKYFTSFERILIVFLWVLLGYVLAISVPTVLDRSLSFYTLEKLQQRGGGIKLSAFEGVYAQEYMKEHRLVDVRLTEQIQSGTIVIENGCVKLTSLGNQIATMSQYFRSHFLPKQRLLRGEYSSDLTNPFRQSTDNVEYQCR